MSDLTPRKPSDADAEEPTAPVSAVAGSTPDETDTAAAAPPPESAAASAPAEPAAATVPAVAAVAAPARERWHRRRVPALAAVGALFLGGLIGGGVVAIGAFAADGDRGDDRVQHGPRFGRDGGDRAEGRDGGRADWRNGPGGEKYREWRRGRDGNTPAPSGSTPPAPAASAPSASA
jgi:hypothetical protein